MNGLTARWAAASDAGEDGAGAAVFSAAGVWPLLAYLADGAEGAARADLAEALGLPAGRAAHAAHELLAAMDAMRGLRTGLGLWTKRTLELRQEWEAALPTEVHGVLTGDPVADHRALDAWTVKRTGGLIDRIADVEADRPRLTAVSQPYPYRPLVRGPQRIEYPVHDNQPPSCRARDRPVPWPARGLQAVAPATPTYRDPPKAVPDPPPQLRRPWTGSQAATPPVDISAGCGGPT
ncbi:serpin family protein [Streptomyces sp. fd1-xmd]|uniref:serpin family protein n=1 Tax=Streptomyces sp. fd1-xmd TaxID=1812480 RepID=UPI00298E6268|nr:serpin family protein [Streptomyces sp. fd1-xmd]